MQCEDWKASYKRLADFFENKGDSLLSRAEVTVCLEWLKSATTTTGTLVHENEAIGPNELMVIDGEHKETIKLMDVTDDKDDIDWEVEAVTTPAQVPSTLMAAGKGSLTVRRSSRKAAIAANAALTVPVKKEIRALLESKRSTNTARPLDATKNKEIRCPHAMEFDSSPKETESETASTMNRPIIITKTAKTILDILGSASYKAEIEEEGLPYVEILPPPSSTNTMQPLAEQPVEDVKMESPKRNEPVAVNTVFPSVTIPNRQIDADLSPAAAAKSRNDLPFYQFDISDITSDRIDSDKGALAFRDLPRFNFE